MNESEAVERRCDTEKVCDTINNAPTNKLSLRHRLVWKVLSKENDAGAVQRRMYTVLYTVLKPVCLSSDVHKFYHIEG